MTNTAASSPFSWLRTGEEALAAMLAAIEGAKKSIRFETYIYNDSDVGRRFRDALLRARERAVEVQVLIDAVGSFTLPQSFWDPLLSAGGAFRWFNPFKMGRWSYRDHRKVLICDDEIAFVGGFNVAPEYEGDGVTHGWRDLGMAVRGKLVAELARTFDDYFTHAAFNPKERRQLRRAGRVSTFDRTAPSVLLSNTGKRRAEMKRCLARDIAAAKTVKIICAYFLPTWRIRTALLNVRRRGGTVQLILAGKSDVVLSQLASRRLYRSLMRAGVEIYEYQPQILHAKLFIMDDTVYVGSANLDTRSLRINHELLVRLPDAKLAAEATEIFQRDLTHSRHVDPVEWRFARNFVSKIKERWAYFVLARLDPYVARLQVRWLR